jgi:tripartite-type tricarboxylate transporter receptor subunit TctC
MARLSHGTMLASGMVFAALVSQSGFAPAQEKYPEHPVRIIVPFSPSGGTDIQARALAQSFLESTGETFVVDNRPGASGLIGAQLTVDSPPDGYTILFTTATLAVNTTLYGNRMKFSAVKDLAPVSWITSTALVLVVHPNVPARTVPELIALEKKSPGFMTAGVNTIGSTSHLSAEMLKQFAHVEHVIVPYRGGGPALIGLMSGETDFLFATAPSAAPHIRSGKVRPLAVTTEKRAAAFPELPTMASFYPGFTADNWYAMFVRSGTPASIITKINAEILKALKSPAVVKFMAEEGLDPVGSTSEQLASLMRGEIAKYSKTIRLAHIKL